MVLEPLTVRLAAVAHVGRVEAAVAAVGEVQPSPMSYLSLCSNAQATALGAEDVW